MTGIKLPRRAIPPFLNRALPSQPTWPAPFGGAVLQRENQKDLPLDVDRDVAPALFEALNGFGGYAQDLRHLVLRLSQMPPDFCELVSPHCRFFPGGFVSIAARDSKH